MRRLVAALIAVMVALALAGCGGGDEPAPETPAEEAPAAPAAPAGGGGGGGDAEVVDNSPLVEGYPMPFPTDPEIVPSTVLERLEADQPMLIYYFDTEHNVEDDVDREIDSVLSDYRGLITRIDLLNHLRQRAAA